MPAPVLLWLLLACLLVLPVVMRLAVGDEEPANEIAQEQERPAPDRAEARLPSRRDTLTPAA